MKLKTTTKKKRIGVIVTLLGLISTVSIFEYGRIQDLLEQNSVILILISISFLIFIIGFIFIFIKTGLWKFTHKSIKSLDEREIAITSKSLRYAYSIFTVFALLLLLSYSVLEMPMSVVLVVFLILFAHLLPASVIAWTEKSFDNE